MSSHRRPPAAWRFAAVAVTALLLGLGVEHFIVHPLTAQSHAGTHAESHAAGHAVDRETPQACDEALALGDDAFKQAKQFGQGMADFHAGALDLLTRGDSGTAVRKLQAYLNKEADADLDVDGDYGPQTEKAVKAYREAQSRHMADSEAFLTDLGTLRGQYETAALDCRLRPPQATTSRSEAP